MATSFKRSTLQSVPPTIEQAIADPRLHRRLLDTHGCVCYSLLWGHCSFLLSPGVHKVLFVPSQSLSPQSCVSSGASTVELMATSSKRAYAIVRSAAPKSPCPCSRPLPPQETLRYSSGSVSVDWVCILHPSQDCKEIQPVHSKGNQS